MTENFAYSLHALILFMISSESSTKSYPMKWLKRILSSDSCMSQSQKHAAGGYRWRFTVCPRDLCKKNLSTGANHQFKWMNHQFKWMITSSMNFFMHFCNITLNPNALKRWYQCFRGNSNLEITWAHLKFCWTQGNIFESLQKSSPSFLFL